MINIETNVDLFAPNGLTKQNPCNPSGGQSVVVGAVNTLGWTLPSHSNMGEVSPSEEKWAAA